jgi:GNAT superfamily N-acetyltransferase
MVNLSVHGPHLGKGSVCAPILRALPQWFGIEEATQHYIESVDEMPTFIAYQGEHEVGFVSIKRHYPRSAEVYVMGVLPTVHRQGTGRKLITACEAWLKQEGVTFLQVKTLSPSHPDEGYKKTHAFYESVGFVELEEFPTLWGERNPCLMLIKYVE